MTDSVVISGSGLWTPAESISNEELVAVYNQWAEQFNQQHQQAIEAGEIDAKPFSSAEFIEKASGIKSRYVYEKSGILDIDRMKPKMPERPESARSEQAEIAIDAAQKALAAAGRSASEVDAVIVSCAYTQRAYPAIAIEVQDALGIQGFGFDMLVACSAATFGLHRAYEMVKAGTARSVLVINPELVSPQLNYCDRDSHFIFGDVATAMLVEDGAQATGPHVFEILGTKAVTQFSNNIRSNFGYMARAYDSDPYGADKLFHQNGRKVFKEVCPMAADHLQQHLADCGYDTTDVRRWWLHQANINMNLLIAKKLLGRDASEDEAPIVLDRFANTASAGSMIAFNLHHQDMQSGELGVLCSFGAGYSIGSLVLKKR
ncbi:Beta-ketodecanoyl-[acyl-carrier-protein] synthase [Saliniradius amylolyticus]|uniref:Beta-ketodecanoyl-[acyl-carrier-protein] synthase n=1 Tax=Saliniradius amylolyticus TaxID=2183582 RepID=A0A2S2E200_9ALTE|nr:beta-ketoacyl-ACP synthase III [Saliniradius amylolyticus]AWL11280.1 Beta-ketodecanoyl-[acyl-carrier-protein] synthase [Saliniradius amylolyticus]